MRQLGARLPVPPPVKTDGEMPSEIHPHERHPLEGREPYPVEVHRIERNLVEPVPVAQPQATEIPPEPLRKPAGPLPDSAGRLRITEAATETRPDPLSAFAGRLPEPPKRIPTPERLSEERAAPVGRWEEFHDFRRLEPGRGGRISLEPMPFREGSPSRLLTADLEGEHRSSFLTLAVPGIAAILALGAIVWSGSLRDRVRQQDATMSTLQEQNQKLADTLAEMNVEQKVSSALNSSPTAASAQNPAAAPTPAMTPGDQPTPAGSGGASTPGDAPVPKEAVAQPEKRQPENGQTGTMQGVSTPPPVGRRSQKGSRYQQPIDVRRAPEIVPPYPTNFKPDNVAANAANSQPVPAAGTYREPFTPGAYQEPVTVARSERPLAAPRTTHVSAPQASGPPPVPAETAAPPSQNDGAAAPYSATSYSATGNGQFASPLAQNIETVESLQRHSPVQLREFHARAGMSTQATPNVRLSVQHPDPSRGSYALVVSEGGSSYQLHGEVNHPLVFADSATHREYALVVLSIADQQVYGYVRAMQ
jgi:hypothetical protein